jgi:hypothetical protein
MPNIGRRFTIEPKVNRPNPTHVRQQAKPSSSLQDDQASRAQPNAHAKGIRLASGSLLMASKRYGGNRSQLVEDLSKSKLIFTVTEHGIDSEAFIRVLYRCPKTVFVQTLDRSEEADLAKQPTQAHKLYQFDRDVGQAVVIRPQTSANDAAIDLETHGIFVQQWFDANKQRSLLQIAATEAWEVLREEKPDPQASSEPKPITIDESSKEFLSAFMSASKHYLDSEEFDLLRDQAWKILNEKM